MATQTFATESFAGHKPPKNEGGTQVLLDAKNIPLKHQRVENEIIPLGPTKVEVVLAEVNIDDLKLDPTNPRIAFALQARGVRNPTAQELADILWEDSDVKALKRSIEANGGLIEAIIVSGKDGTILEGNCRVTCLRKLRDDTKGEDPRWTHARARILPAGVDRQTIDVLLGELHIAGKNEWTPFEQAAHLYRMHMQKAFSIETLAEMYRTSKSYVVAKIKAYRLMTEVYVPLAQSKKKDVHDLSRDWSWFEEFYKKCKPSAQGKEDPNRPYDGELLEKKFCEWKLQGLLPQAADVRKLGDLLDNAKAMAILEKDGIEKAFDYISTLRPELSSKLWRQVHTAATYLQNMPLSEIEAIRQGEPAKSKVFDELVLAMERVKKELKK